MPDKIDRVEKNDPTPRSYKWALSWSNFDFTFHALENMKSVSNTIRNDGDGDNDDCGGGGGGVNNNNNNNNYYYYYYHHHHHHHQHHRV